MIIHGSKLNHLLKTVLKHAFCLCLLTDTSVSTDLHMHINSLPAEGAVCSGIYSGLPVTAALNATLSCIQENRNYNYIEAFQKMVGSFQKYIHVKTPALHFNFETCSA